jgi:hypothetical protein
MGKMSSSHSMTSLSLLCEERAAPTMNEKRNLHSDAYHGQTQSPSSLYRRILDDSGLDIIRMSHVERMYYI